MRLWHRVGTPECDRMLKQMRKKYPYGLPYVWVWKEEWKHDPKRLPEPIIGVAEMGGVEVGGSLVIPWAADGMFIKSIDKEKIPWDPASMSTSGERKEN